MKEIPVNMKDAFRTLLLVIDDDDDQSAILVCNKLSDAMKNDKITGCAMSPFIALVETCIRSGYGSKADGTPGGTRAVSP